MMDAWEIIERIAKAEKKTPVRVFLREKEPVDYGTAEVFGPGDKVLFGDWRELGPILAANREKIGGLVVEWDRRNSALPLLDLRELPARVEPGAILREGVELGEGAVVMMGAILNIGASVGPGSMIDMGAVLGGRATVGARCHIGAGAVLAGVVEPPSALPVVIEDEVLIGANAVVLEGVRVGRGAVVAAGSVVTGDIPPGMVAAGVPARIVKKKDPGTEAKTQLVDALREL